MDTIRRDMKKNGLTDVNILDRNDQGDPLTRNSLQGGKNEGEKSKWDRFENIKRGVQKMPLVVGKLEKDSNNNYNKKHSYSAVAPSEPVQRCGNKAIENIVVITKVQMPTNKNTP